MEPCFVYVTTVSRIEAMVIGRAVVRERLAACANVVDNMTSVYWWEGEVRDGNDKAANFLTGQVMKLSRGKANPKVVTETILQKLRS